MKNITYYKAKFIIVWDENQHKTLKDGYLGVLKDQICGFYHKVPSGAKVIDFGNAAITPGFINLHSHPSEVYGSRSYLEDIGNPCFYGSNLYDNALYLSMSPESAEYQTKLNLTEMVKSGCTTLVIYGGKYSDMEAEIAGRMGLRAYVGGAVRAGGTNQSKGIWHSPDGHNLIFQFDEEEGMKRLDEAVSFIKNIDGGYAGRIHGMIAPTQTMTCTPAMLKACRREADRLGCLLSIHGAESLIEMESCMRMYGMTPVQYMKENGLLAEDVIVAHCLFITGHSRVSFTGNDDLKILAESGATVAHSPQVYMRSGNLLESLSAYKKAGINLGLGTDAFPSDYIQEMRCAAACAKAAAHGAMFSTKASDIFEMATTGGAKALHRKDIGRLEAGAKADFVVFDLDQLEMTPVRDLIKVIVYSATRFDVKHVFVDGRQIVKDGEIEGICEEKLAALLQQEAEKAWATVSRHDSRGRTVDEISPLCCPEYHLEA